MRVGNGVVDERERCIAIGRVGEPVMGAERTNDGNEGLCFLWAQCRHRGGPGPRRHTGR